MTDLSPAAQAVLDAANAAYDAAATVREGTAAALRAAVAQTQRYRTCDADELLAIAAELEAK